MARSTFDTARRLSNAAHAVPALRRLPERARSPGGSPSAKAGTRRGAGAVALRLVFTGAGYAACYAAGLLATALLARGPLGSYALLCGMAVCLLLAAAWSIVRLVLPHRRAVQAAEPVVPSVVEAAPSRRPRSFRSGRAVAPAV